MNWKSKNKATSGEVRFEMSILLRMLAACCKTTEVNIKVK